MFDFKMGAKFLFFIMQFERWYYINNSKNKEIKMAIKIYSCENSRGVRPIWTAEEMGLDYELIMMPFPPRVFMKEYLETNMLGTVPFMVDGSVKMTESVAISQYLVEKYGPSDLQVTPDEDDYPNYCTQVPPIEFTWNQCRYDTFIYRYK